MTGAGHETRSHRQRHHAGALGTDQGPGDVEAVLRQQLLEIEARHAPANLRELRPDRVSVTVAQRFQLRIDFTLAPALSDNRLELTLRSRPHPHAQTVVGQNLQRLDVLGRLARHDRMRTAGVVADHAAQRTAAVGGRIGPEGQLMRLRGITQNVAHDAGLDFRRPRIHIERQHPVQILRGIQNDGDIAGLAGEAGAATAHQNRRLIATGDGNRLHDVVERSRNHDPDRHLPVVRGIRRIQRAAAGIEAHLASDHAAQLGCQGLGREHGIFPAVGLDLLIRHRISHRSVQLSLRAGKRTF